MILYALQYSDSLNNNRNPRRSKCCQLFLNRYFYTIFVGVLLALSFTSKARANKYISLNQIGVNVGYEFPEIYFGGGILVEKFIWNMGMCHWDNLDEDINESFNGWFMRMNYPIPTGGDKVFEIINPCLLIGVSTIYHHVDSYNLTRVKVIYPTSSSKWEYTLDGGVSAKIRILKVMAINTEIYNQLVYKEFLKTKPEYNLEGRIGLIFYFS